MQSVNLDFNNLSFFIPSSNLFYKNKHCWLLFVIGKRVSESLQEYQCNNECLNVMKFFRENKCLKIFTFMNNYYFHSKIISY